MLIVLVGGFLCFFDFAYAAVTQLLLENGAARVARADTVGLNDFQQAKSLRVSMIPVSGARTAPEGNSSASELALVRSYLQAENWAEANGTLNYERWSTLTHDVTHADDTCTVQVNYVIPKTLPSKFATLFAATAPCTACTTCCGLSNTCTTTTTCDVCGTQALRAKWSIEDHASLYLTR